MPSAGVASPHDEHRAGQEPAACVLTPARSRLTARLDRFGEVMVVQAPPGFGKTVLLDRWLADARADGRQVHHLRAGMLRLEDLAGLPGGAVLAVDDVDQALAPELTEALLALPQQPGQVRVLLSGRDVAGVRRASWRRGLQVSTLDVDELAATLAELRDMARDWGHDLDEDQVADLHTATSGWPGVARMILDGSGPGTSWPDLDAAVDYLDATVLDPLAEPVRRAAAALALADEISYVDVAAVAAAEEVSVSERELLTCLEGARLLLRHAVRECWTTLPALRHALRVGRHAPSAATARRWHRSFAQALQQYDEEANIPRILRHARAGEDWEVLNQIWTRYGIGLLDRCHDEMARAYGDLPLPVVARWSYLSVPDAVVGWTTQKRPYADVHRAFSHSLRPLAATYRGSAEVEMDVEDRLAGAAAVLVTERMDGHLNGALEVAEQVQAEVAPMIAGGPVPMRYAWFLMQWAMTALAAADWRRAVQLFARAFDVAQTIRGAEFIPANCASNAALLTVVDGSTTDARHWLTQYEHFADPSSHSYGHVSQAAHLARALLAMDQLDEEGTERHMDAAGEVGTDLDLWPCNLYVRSQHALVFGDPVGMLSNLDGIRATHSAHVGDVGAGQRLLHRMEVDLLLALGEVNRAQALLSDRTEPWLATSRARLHLITGDHERARSWASAGTWAPTVTTRDRLDRLMIHAAAAERQGRSDVADRTFRQAGALAAQIGTLRSFPLVPRAILDRLLARSPGVLEGVQRNLVRGARSVYPAHAALITLSEREQVVLEQMARFDNIREIAAALTVSPNTVKKQVVAVYAKLGVHDRESALLEAHRLGLLAG